MIDDDKKFIEWIGQAYFYCGLDRYNQFHGNHVFATSYEENDKLADLIYDLDLSDDDANEAAQVLKKMRDDGLVWIGCSNYPHIAIYDLYAQLKVYYYSVIEV